MPPAQYVQATATTFRILDALNDHGQVGVTRLANHLDMPKSTVHKYLSTLLDLGYVTKSDAEYRLSLSFAGLGVHALHARSIYQDVKQPIDQLAESTEEHAGVYIATDTTGFPLYATRGPRALLDDIDTEPVPALHCHAAGKAILAEFSDDQLAPVIDAGLTACTSNTITTGNELRKELTRIQERGVAFDRGEQHEDVRSAAIPLSLDGHTAAVYVTGPLDRMRGKRLEENIPGLLSNTVNQLTAVHEA